ncbi:MAG TPA: DUF3750 domain-containing protein [Povalibacter sp.]|mgnify:CR=1 FL=1|uniref:DUF3750 domain-containing protein n=1 Tax=Povalibacter sp. TaxID=1962978 RepID=UPI002C2AAB20|nr:DUF3750 domain-containing protein [Povalibacter sp.]HMN45573.1 DUF3750 domain-containing protein [Povalibacter sp.]
MLFTRKVRFLLLALVCLFAVGCLTVTGSRDWRSANRGPSGLAPDPLATPEAVVQVYSARTVSWKGYFGVHTWIAAKRSDADKFLIYEVIGYRLRRTGNVVVVRDDRPADGYWYGNRPELLSDVRGAGVDALIDRIEDAVQRYPYRDAYRVWPGPNSNTFTAFVAREVPELRVDLPPTAIGKDYLGLKSVGATPSGTGGQVNLFGVAGVLVGVEEGVEVNLLGLTFGVDPRSLSLKLPLIGRIGPGGNAEPVTLSHGAAAVPAVADNAT